MVFLRGVIGRIHLAILAPEVHDFGYIRSGMGNEVGIKVLVQVIAKAQCCELATERLGMPGLYKHVEGFCPESARLRCQSPLKSRWQA